MNDARKTVENLFGGGRPPRPGGGGGGTQLPKIPGGLIALGVGAVIALWGVGSVFYTVQPEERGVVKRFGEVVKIADPGLHFKLPFGIDTVQLVATERVLKQEFGFRTTGVDADGASQYSDGDHNDESLMLSGDLNIIDVEWVVQYRIADPMQYIYSMREPTRTLRDISESVMRRAVGNRLGSEVLTTARVEISNLVRDEVQQAMERYETGIHIVTVELQDVVPPRAVQPAFNEVNEARQERERMINEAQKQANQQIPLARGQANRVIAEAEGYATERVNQARGETARFSAILAEYRTAPEVTRTRMYLETLNGVLPKIGSVVVQQDGQIAPVPLINLRDAQPAAKGERR
ncbi:FtsH protease activity modulator HflK [Aquimonas voraii]|uniref:Protein HflK n=1 Tax=Aquimonas voraii TaxID=265719 RepID=A0A1G6VJ01_9GAMM|nr:FtsH protease activity modulator HflK [Aquimonas voraii]SDD53363.1 protease FtsH subunit HflK [Aquimonas voraii]